MPLHCLQNPHPELVISFNDGILDLAIHRPSRKNALYGSLYLALEQAMLEANSIPAVRVVILRGFDADFTAGNDLQDFEASSKLGLEAPPFRLLRAVSQLSKPLLIAVRGVAVGIGTTLLLHADLVYCDHTARFQLPFSSLGLSPEGAASLLLPRQVGYLKAAELLMLAEPFYAQTAEKMGLVNYVIDTNLYACVQLKARQLAALPAVSLQLTKAMLKNTDPASTLDRINHEGEIFLQRMQSDEMKEAINAFAEKRVADFSRLN